MTNAVDPRNSDLKPGDSVNGYHLKRIVMLEEIDAFFYELEHIVTGARHVHVSRADKENTFSVAFKTIPSDSTGVAHILEHTVLCGSRKFPVRDPFFSMLKRSLSTFMNAFTASDWTMYPFCTQNRKDFYNLSEVYLDAAFFPKLEELSFKQEGHRLELENDAEAADVSQLAYKGVVYNEMKGAMSSPDQVMVRSLLNAMYPDTTYSNNSGGDPAVIPTLTYQQLKDFHQRHYHPSNAYFYTYGDQPLRGHLAFIQENVLKAFERIDPRTDVSPQPRWNGPRKAAYTYPLAKTEDPTRKSQVCVAWLTTDIRDTFEVLSLTLLEQILLGNPASPLRKALIESGLGSALSDGSGYDSDNLDTLFSCGLKNVKASDAEKIEAIIFDVLNGLCRKGIDAKLIDSAIHQLEFHRKEVTNQPYPYGIQLLLAFAGSWIHGGDPVKILKFDADMARLREKLAQGPFFENMIQKYFIDNPHRIRFTLAPDQNKQEIEDARVAEELKEIRSSLGQSELIRIQKDAEALKKLQEARENISLLPTLGREDIPPDVEVIRATDAFQGEALTFYEQPTSGIFYLSAAAGAGMLPPALLPLVPFFCFAFPKAGTALSDYTDMVQRIDLYTGGIGVSAHARTRFDEKGACLPFITLNGKCLVRNQAKMFDIVGELMHQFDFADLKRLKTLCFEYRSGLESMIIQGGHRFALSLAARNFSTKWALNETWSGIHQIQTIKKITDEISDEKRADDALKSLSEALSSIGKHVFARNNLKIALIGDRHALSAAVALTESMRSGLDAGIATGGFDPPAIDPGSELPREGWSTSSAVSFVAQAFETVRMQHADAPALSVISKMLRSLYLHREIREKGGAYGGFAIYNAEDGLFSLASYRDPHIVATLKVFETTQDFIRAGSFSDEDIKEAVLQVCSEIDKPDPPGPASRKAFYRNIMALSDEARRRYKQRLLKLTRQDVVQAAETYFTPEYGPKAVAVISGEDQLKAANAKLADHRLKLHKI